MQICRHRGLFLLMCTGPYEVGVKILEYRLLGGIKVDMPSKLIRYQIFLRN